MRGTYPGPYSFPKPPEKKHAEACIRDPQYPSTPFGVCGSNLTNLDYRFEDIKHAMTHYAKPGTSGIVVCSKCQVKVREKGLDQ